MWRFSEFLWQASEKAFLSGAFVYGVLIEKYCFYLSKCPAASCLQFCQENCNSQL